MNARRTREVTVLILAQLKERILASVRMIAALLVIALAPLPGHASVTFEHDTRGRVTKATYSDGTIIDYTYDANGNRSTAIVTQPNDSTAPTVPGNVTATAVSATQINLSWAASTDTVAVTDYVVQRCTGAGCTSFSQIATPTGTTYSDTARTANTTYVYRVSARDAAGNQSNWSASASATTLDSSAPTAPGAPTFTNITMTSATASWAAATDDVGVTGYDYRLDSGAWQSLGNVLTRGLTGLSAATSYTFQVRARDAANNIGPASSATFTTPDTSAPSAPGTPTFSNVAMNSAIANWTAANDNVEVVGYDYRLGSGNWEALGNVSSVGLTGLSAATSYTFQVRARDAANNVGPASSGNFTTTDTSAPTAPGGLTASAPSSTTVNLSWTASSDNVAVTGYKIFRSGTQIGTSSTTSYADNTTSGRTTYSYTVSAYDAAGNNSPQASAVSITTPDTIAPGTPTGLTAAAASPTQVNLSWNGVGDTGGSGLAGYRIYRNGSHIHSTTGTTYSDTGVAAGTAYSYTVAAYDNAGNVSGQSNAASVTTPVPLQATINRTSWSWLYQVGQGHTISSNAVVTASGGAGGYTYSWQRVSGDTVATALNPTSNSTGWTRSVPQYHQDYTSVWRCQVTDSAGNTVYSPNITVNFRAENLE